MCGVTHALQGLRFKRSKVLLGQNNQNKNTFDYVNIILPCG